MKHLNAKEQLHTAVSASFYKREMSQCLDIGLTLTCLLHTSKLPNDHNLHTTLLKKASSRPLQREDPTGTYRDAQVLHRICPIPFCTPSTPPLLPGLARMPPPPTYLSQGSLSLDPWTPF